MNASIAVLLAVARPTLRARLYIALAGMPGFRIAGEAATGTETRRLCQATRPAVVLLDHHLAGPAVAETLVTLGRLCPETRVMVLAPPAATAAVCALVARGAAGAVSLDESPAVIARAVAAVAHGGTWCSPPFLSALARGMPPSPDQLTPCAGEVSAWRTTGWRHRRCLARFGTTSPAREDDHGSGVA